MNRVFSWKLSRARDARRFFRELLMAATQLYLDYLFVFNDLAKLGKVALPEMGPSVPDVISRDREMRETLHREMALRKRFRERLESLECWRYFSPQNVFSDSTGLNRLEDYIDNFSHHLPEIHEETFRVEREAKRFCETCSNVALARVSVGLEHLGRNHISFVHFALEWAADEISWRE